MRCSLSLAETAVAAFCFFHHLMDELDYPVHGANGSPLVIHGRISLGVRVGRQVVRTNFLVCDSLQVACLLGTDFIQYNVYAIYARDRYVQMAEESGTPIVRIPTLASTPVGTKVENLIRKRDAALRSARDQPPSGDDSDAGQDYPVLSDKIRAAEGVALPPRSQT